MASILLDFLNAFGPILGPLLLAISVGLGIVLHLVTRLMARFAGLTYLLVDKGLVTNADLIKYGALDDPKNGPALKGVLP